MNTLQSNPVSQPDIDDVNIKSIQTLITPAELKRDLPLSEIASQTVLKDVTRFVIFWMVMTSACLL